MNNTVQSTIHDWLLKAPPAPLPVVSTPSTVRRRKIIIHDSEDEDEIVLAPANTKTARSTVVAINATKTEPLLPSGTPGVVVAPIVVAPAITTACREADVATTATNTEPLLPSGTPEVVVAPVITISSRDSDKDANATNTESFRGASAITKDDTDATNTSPRPADMPVLLTDSGESDDDAIDVTALICEEDMASTNNSDLEEAMCEAECCSNASDGPIRRRASREAILACNNDDESIEFQVRGVLHVHTTPILIKEANAIAVDPGSVPIDPLNLWKALPKAPCQFLDMSAKHESDAEDRDSYHDSDSSELSEGFIAKDDDAIHGVPAKHRKFLSKMLPVTMRALSRVNREARYRRKDATAVFGRAIVDEAAIAAACVPAVIDKDAIVDVHEDTGSPDKSRPPSYGSLQTPAAFQLPVAPTFHPLTPSAPKQAIYADFIAQLWAAGEWSLDDVHTALEKAGGSFNVWSNRPSQREALFLSVLQHLKTSEEGKVPQEVD